MDFFHTPIEYLKGIGSYRAEILRKEIKINTFGDLLYYFPYKHMDKSKLYTVNDIFHQQPDYAQLLGSVEDMQVFQHKFGKRLIVQLKDLKNQYVEIVWFNNIQFWQKNLLMKKKYIAFGKITYFMNRIQIVHPEIEDYAIWEKNPKIKLYPMYHTTEKMKSKNLNTKAIVKAQQQLFLHLENQLISETIPEYLIKKLSLCSIRESLTNMHFPKNFEELQRAKYRNKFEELFFLQLRYNYIKKGRHQKKNGSRFEKVGDLFNNFYNYYLPFSLTEAQKKVLKEIRYDTGSNFQMNRLLQGDVGSGKTIVALLALLLALDNGYQACIMAPTEILAFQHFENIKSLLKELPINVGLLTGSTKSKQKKQLLEAIKNFSVHLLIGTHALIEKDVQFNKLGLVVIDEQHRFGVEQRSKFIEKGNPCPHILVMTATPIPRSLALTVYGDLDYSIIDELPPGRKHIKTIHKYDLSRGEVMKFIATEIEKGRQTYMVFPLIEESEKLDYENIMEGYEQIK
ncbi:MAG: ATP-dependent DNA helicase RecG, partial [Chitinophagaceae bacterium]